MINQTDFTSLTLDLQDIFNEVASAKVGENVGFQVFKVMDTNRRSFIHQLLHGVSGIKRVTPGQDLPRVNTEQGDQITWTQEYFGAIVAVTKEMRKFDLFDEIEGLARSIVEDSFDKVDQSFADVLSSGGATSYQDVYGDSVSAVGPDGLALFSASHSNPLSSATYSNIITDGTTTNPALSRVAIVNWRAVGKKHSDPNGLLRPIDYDTLIVGPDNEDLAQRIVESDQLSGVGNNDINPLKGKIKHVIVWPRLATASDGTDTSAFWYLADMKKVKETLQAKFAERPSLDAPEQAYANKNWDYSIDYFYTVGRGYAPYIARSDATLS